MSPDVEEAEHSLEMHLPYIHRIIQRTFGTSDDAISKYPGIVPIMVGATRQATEERLGEILAPFFRDPHTAIVISSDFAHWGQRFQYRFYSANAKTPALPLPLSAANLPQPNRGLTPARLEETLARLREGARPAAGARGRPYIHESISACDIAAMEALTLYPLASKQQADDPQGFEGSSVFNAVDGFTLAMNAAGGNTICGRHPISVALHALEHLYEGEDPSDEQEARFRFLRYERSGDVVSPTDSSVSYVSAVATLP
ncbi:hypothetical protein KEM55_003226 [Ascosphaera atra]|nr:hypothetical protein KEM55_003226 [Ascosphaera atra]